MSHIRVSPRGDLVAFSTIATDGTTEEPSRSSTSRDTRRPDSVYNSEEGLGWGPKDGRSGTPPDTARRRLHSRGDASGRSASFTRASATLPSSTSLGTARCCSPQPESARDDGRQIRRRARARHILVRLVLPVRHDARRNSFSSRKRVGCRSDLQCFRSGNRRLPRRPDRGWKPVSLSPDGKSPSRPRWEIRPSWFSRLSAPESRGLFAWEHRARGGPLVPRRRRILVEGHEPGHGSRLYIVEPEGGSARPVSGEGVRINGANPISPDGSLVTATDRDGKAVAFSLAGAPRPIPGLSPDDEISRWTEDGRSSMFPSRGAPARVVRLNLATGKKEPWKDVLPSDSSASSRSRDFPHAGRKNIRVQLPEDLSQLFFGEGLK